MTVQLAETTTTIRLGDAVIYRDRDGRAKAAIVTATPDTIPGVDEQTGTGAPQPGHAHLTVLSFTGHVYTKHDVPEGDGPSTWTAR